jgi:hypothetical protein
MAQLQTTTVSGTLSALRTENTTAVSKTLALADRDKVVACTNTSAITITIPNDTTVNFPVGSVVWISKVSTGAVTVAAAAGVTVSRTGNLNNFEELYLRKRAANTWVTVDQPGEPPYVGGVQTTSTIYTVHTFTTTGTNTSTLG